MTNRTKTAQASALNIITYYRGNYKNQKGKSPVYLYVYMCGERVVFNTGVHVPADSWDLARQIVCKSYPGSADLNLIIKNCRARLSDIFVRYRLQHRLLTPDLLKKEYDKPSYSIDFLAFMQDAILERKGEITDSSLQQHQAHLNKLKEFQERIAFSELDEDFFVRYQRWLKTEKSNGQNTRHNSIKTLRTYLNIAKRKKLIDENPLRHMPVRRTQTDRQFLSNDELQSLVNLYREKTLPNNYQRVLRHYLFACFTGIRISDLRRIRMEDIIADTLVLMPYKTKNVNAHTIHVPLGKVARELIADESPFRFKGHVFTPYSEPRMRLYLKDVFKHAKIYRPLSFHSSRHTFATIFLRKTKNLAALQKILGHGKIDQTMIYAHILTEDVEAEMKAMDSF